MWKTAWHGGAEPGRWNETAQVQILDLLLANDGTLVCVTEVFLCLTFHDHKRVIKMVPTLVSLEETDVVTHVRHLGTA